MRRFRFRLQKLLEVRQLREDLARQELAMAHQVLEREKAILEGIRATFSELVAGLRGSFRGDLDIGDIEMHQRYFGLLDAMARERRACVDRLAREEAAKREAVMEARRERTAVEKLRERAYARYCEEAARAEQAFLDEVATTRYAREGGDERGGNIVLHAVRRL